MLVLRLAHARSAGRVARTSFPNYWIGWCIELLNVRGSGKSGAAVTVGILDIGRHETTGSQATCLRPHRHDELCLCMFLSSRGLVKK